MPKRKPRGIGNKCSLSFLMTAADTMRKSFKGRMKAEWEKREECRIHM